MLIDKNYIIKTYRELHQVPEIGFDLPKTTAIVKRELDAIGIPYTDKIGTSCIIATLNEGVGNKTIAIRADMDALPMQEESGVDFPSTHPNRMHACGHDAHTAMLLGTAKAMKAIASQINCCVKFVFQAAEEILAGAKSICDTGFMDQVDEIVACHVTSEIPYGAIRLNYGRCYAASRGVNLHLYGKSAHITDTRKGVDAIDMAFRVYNDIKQFRDRELETTEKVTIGLGAIHGGTVNNTICDHVEMKFSLRTQSTQLNEQIYERINEIAQKHASEMGGRAELETYKYVPAFANDPEIRDTLAAIGKKLLGEENVLPKKDSMGGEDFSYYALYKPAAMFDLGTRVTDGPYYSLHTNKVRVNEDALDTPPKIFIQYVLDRMEK